MKPHLRRFQFTNHDQFTSHESRFLLAVRGGSAPATSFPIAIAPGNSSQPQRSQNSRPRELSFATKMIAR